MTNLIFVGTSICEMCFMTFYSSGKYIISICKIKLKYWHCFPFDVGAPVCFQVGYKSKVVNQCSCKVGVGIGKKLSIWNACRNRFFERRRGGITFFQGGKLFPPIFFKTHIWFCLLCSVLLGRARHKRQDVTSSIKSRWHNTSRINTIKAHHNRNT